MQNLIQVAGILDAIEAKMILDCGADWLGFPFRLTHNREDLTESAAAKIISFLPAPNRGVLITYLTDPDEIIALCQCLGTFTLQLHNKITARALLKLRQMAPPDIFILKSLIVRQNNLDALLRQASDLGPFVDAFITDTFDPASGASGATGKTHDWLISKRLVESTERPVMLAGGLTPENVGEAILNVRPAAVDSHTGLEGKYGRKDAEKVKTFVTNARAAFKSISP